MFLIVQNDPQCPPGSLLQLLADAGATHTLVAAYGDSRFPDPAGLTGVIVLGGDMGVHETESFPHLEEVRLLMRRTLDAGTPLLGICLGGQLLAQVAGGAVASPSPHGEKGITTVHLTQAGVADPLFSGVANPFVTFQLHNDSFSLPPAANLLGRSDACPAQAFRLGTNAYGVQFHPEVDPAIVDCWGRLSEPPLDLLTPFCAARDPFTASSHLILANFLSLCLNSRHA